MNCGHVLLILTVLIVGVAYYLYTPFPNDALEPHKQIRLSFAVEKLFLICNIKDYLGLTSWQKCIRTPKLKNRDLSDETLKVSDVFFDGVEVRLYVPRGEHGLLPAIVYLHGGGWIVGNTDAYHPLTKSLARSLPAVVASVEYRLAPEHTFPLPLDDCVKATRYLIQNAMKYGVDPSRVAVAGDSSGGNLAMAVGAKLMNDPQPPRCLGLIYPALQLVDFSTPSYSTFRSRPYVLHQRRMVTFYLNYVFGHEKELDSFVQGKHVSDALRSQLESKINIDLLPQKYQSLRVKYKLGSADKVLAGKVQDIVTNKYISPLLLDDEELKKLPKTYLLTCEYDPLRDDGFILSRRWKDLGFPVKHVHWEGVQHGFFPPGSRDPMNITVKANIDFINYLKAEL